jgi:hypothetical protein
LKKEAAQYFQKRVREIYDAIPSDTSHDWSTYAITRIGGFQWYIDEAPILFTASMQRMHMVQILVWVELANCLNGLLRAGIECIY